MAIENTQLTFHVAAGQDLSDTAKGTGVIYKAINVTSGMIAPSGNTATGILVQGAQINNHVSFAFLGISKYTANAAIVNGAPLTVTTSGYFTTAVSGSFVVGQALEAATSGSVHTGMFNFANPFYVSNSGGFA